MNSKTAKALIVSSVIFLILLADQISKIWVKTNMALFGSIHIFDWFQIHFVENPGMAFGIDPGNKLFLTLFRIVAMCLIIFFISRLIKQNYGIGFILCITLVLAGATGNIIDSVFYGMIFEAAHPGRVASFVPWGEGYAALFHGNVVDMFFFPLIRTNWPEWFPWIGGNELLFFRFIFNVADASIIIGVASLLIFYRRTLSYSLLSKKEREKIDKERLESQDA